MAHHYVHRRRRELDPSMGRTVVRRGFDDQGVCHPGDRRGEWIQPRGPGGNTDQRRRAGRLDLCSGVLRRACEPEPATSRRELVLPDWVLLAKLNRDQAWGVLASEHSGGRTQVVAMTHW